jgi:molybdopterin/thiamine biosynthesis adenylyltransferase
MKHIYIIGGGGVGSWLAPALCLLKKPSDITIVDGDKLEKKNLNRQLFTEEDIGTMKADALAKKYGCNAIPQWFSVGLLELHRTDFLMCCVDNHTGRRAALESCDLSGCQTIIAGNEVTSSEAYYYHRDWKGSPIDPRVYYPDIATDKTNDPISVSIGCTGEAQEANRQLVTANMMAASLAGHMFVIWGIEKLKLAKEMVEHLPYLINQNLTASVVKKVKGNI